LDRDRATPRRPAPGAVGSGTKLTVPFGQTILLDVFEEQPRDIFTSQENVVDVLLPKKYPGPVSVVGRNLISC